MIDDPGGRIKLRMALGLRKYNQKRCSNLNIEKNIRAESILHGAVKGRLVALHALNKQGWLLSVAAAKTSLE